MLLLMLGACGEHEPNRVIVGAHGTGTLHYASWVDDAQWCDVVVDLLVEADADPCVGCDFELEVSTTVVESRSAPDCVLDPRYSFQEEWEGFEIERVGYDAFYRDYEGSEACPYYDEERDVLAVDYRFYGTAGVTCYYTYGMTDWYWGTSVTVVGEGLTHDADHLGWTLSPDPGHAQLAHEPPIADRIDVSAELDFTPVYETGVHDTGAH